MKLKEVLLSITLSLKCYHSFSSHTTHIIHSLISQYNSNLPNKMNNININNNNRILTITKNKDLLMNLDQQRIGQAKVEDKFSNKI